MVLPSTAAGGGGLRLLSWLLWLIPLSIIGGAGYVGYREYDRVRSKPEVTVGLVQRMTTGEAEKLLSAKGYLKSQKQAMIGTKVAGRVEEMRVQEHDQVKTGDILAVIEHHDLLAMIEQRKAGLERTKAELEESKADLWEKDREANRAERLVAKKMVPQEDYEKASSVRKMAVARVAALEASLKMMKANIDEMEYTRKYQMHIVAPFDGTVVEKQGEVGEIISPMAMSSSLGPVGGGHPCRSESHGRRDRHLGEHDVADRPGSARGGLRRAPIPTSGTRAGCGRSSRWATARAAPSRSRWRSSIPTTSFFPSWRRPSTSCPSRPVPQAETDKAYLFVPKSAVFQENGHDYVWVVGKKSQVNKRHVEVATTKEDLARVESGLESGETVVLNPPKSFKDK